MNAKARGRVLVASNRGPVSFRLSDDGKLTSSRGGGGMVSGLSSVAGQAEVLWVCAALSDADRTAARAAPGGYLDTPDASLDGAGSAVRMLDIPVATFERAYNGVANSTLWFVHHMLYDTPNRPHFGLAFRREWESFRLYNAAFADALADGSGPEGRGGVRAMVQDYHLTLVPRMLADRRPDVAIGYFCHTPWAPPDYFAILPDDVGREVLDGVLGADRAGGTVRHRGHTTTIGVHPLGVDAAELRERAAAADVQAHVAALSAAAGDRRLIVRVDRTELSKNIVRGLAAYRELLVSQ